MQKASVTTVNTPRSQQNFRNFLFERRFCAQNQLAEASRHFPLWFGWFLAGGALLDWTKGYCGDATTRLSFFSLSIFRCVNYYQPHRVAMVTENLKLKTTVFSFTLLSFSTLMLYFRYFNLDVSNKTNLNDCGLKCAAIHLPGRFSSLSSFCQSFPS